MKSLIVFFILLGIIFIITGENENLCLPNKIEYRYIPRAFEQEQMDRVPILGTFGKLFTHVDEWSLSQGYPGIFYNKKEEF